MALTFEQALPLIQQQTGNQNITDALSVYNKNPSAYGTVGSESAGIASLNLAPAQLAATKDFFAAKPTAEQIYNRATELNLSPQQIASAWTQATGGPYATGLQAVNQYLAETGKSFTGVPQLTIGSQYIGPQYEKSTPATQRFINKAIGGQYTADMLTPEIATELMRRAMTTGVPTSTFDMYGGLENIRKTYEKAGGGYDPSKFGTKYFSPSDLASVQSFLQKQPTGQEIFKRASELGLNPFQVATLYSEATKTPFQDAFANVQNYLKSTKQSLPGGFSYIPSERPGYTIDASGKITTGGTTGGISTLPGAADYNALVTQAYKDVLGRTISPTDPGFSYYLSQLQSGAIKPSDLASSIAYGSTSLADQLAAQKFLGKDIFGTEADLRSKYQTGFDQAITDVFGGSKDIEQLESLLSTKDRPFELSKALESKYFESAGSLEDIRKQLQESNINKAQEAARAASTAMNLYGIDAATAQKFSKDLYEGKSTDPLAKEYYDALVKGTVTPELQQKLIANAAKADTAPNAPYFKANPQDLLYAKSIGELKRGEETSGQYGFDPRTGFALISEKAFNKSLDENGDVFIGGFQDLYDNTSLQYLGADPHSKYQGHIGRGTGALGVTASKDEIADFARIEKELAKLGGVQKRIYDPDTGNEVDVVYIPQKDPETGQVNNVPIPAEQFFRMQLADKYPVVSEEDPSSQARFTRNFTSTSAYDYYKDTKEQLNNIANQFVYKDPSKVPQYKDIKEAYDDLNNKTKDLYLWRGRTNTLDPEAMKKLGIEDPTADDSHIEVFLEKKGDYLVPKVGSDQKPMITPFKFSDPNTSSGLFGDIFNGIMEVLSIKPISMALGAYMASGPLAAASQSLGQSVITNLGLDAALANSTMSYAQIAALESAIGSSILNSGIGALPAAAGGDLDKFGRSFLTNLAGSGVQLGSGMLLPEGTPSIVPKALGVATTAGLSGRDLEDALARIGQSEGIKTLLSNVPTGDFDKTLISAFMPSILSGNLTPQDVIRIAQAVNPPKK